MRWFTFSAFCNWIFAFRAGGGASKTIFIRDIRVSYRTISTWGNTWLILKIKVTWWCATQTFSRISLILTSLTWIITINTRKQPFYSSINSNCTGCIAVSINLKWLAYRISDILRVCKAFDGEGDSSWIKFISKAIFNIYLSLGTVVIAW